MTYLVSEALLRLVKPVIALIIAALLYWLITGPIGEPGSSLLALTCWISAAAFVLLVETGLV